VKSTCLFILFYCFFQALAAPSDIAKRSLSSLARTSQLPQGQARQHGGDKRGVYGAGVLGYGPLLQVGPKKHASFPKLFRLQRIEKAVIESRIRPASAANQAKRMQILSPTRGNFYQYSSFYLCRIFRHQVERSEAQGS